MLVLTRKETEEVRIGEEVVVRVVSVSGGRVKIGIEAPRTVRVMRGEMLPPENAGSSRIESPQVRRELIEC